MDSLAWRSTQVAELVRADERISYLYVERCTLGRDENAITITNAGGIVHVPAAALGCLLLGPGTRVTHQVMLLLASSGAAAIWCGEAGARFYAGGVGLSRSSKVVEAQAARTEPRPHRRRLWLSAGAGLTLLAVVAAVVVSTPLAPWFDRQGLIQAECRAAVVTPQGHGRVAAHLDKARRVAAAFGVDFLTVEENAGYLHPEDPV